MSEHRRATIADVAARAAVSASTVSRAMSGRGYVAPAVRRRIAAAAADIGYLPDLTARNLRAGTRRDIGVLISDLRDPFYAELAAGIEERLRAADYHMLLVNDAGSAAHEEAAVRTFASLRVPGVILTPVSGQSVDALLGHGIRVVQADRVGSVRADSVVSDNDTGARTAVAHLIALGHRHIALVIDEQAWTTGAGRLAGYRGAHADAGLTVDERLIVLTGLDTVDMVPALRALLVEHPQVTALLAANNALSEIAFQQLQALGRRVPEDVSLVGYDDVPWMRMVRPQVSTVAQHAGEIGRRSAELLISRLVEPRPGPVVSLLVSPSLRARSSSGRSPDRSDRPTGPGADPHSAVGTALPHPSTGR